MEAPATTISASSRAAIQCVECLALLRPGWSMAAIESRKPVAAADGEARPRGVGAAPHAPRVDLVTVCEDAGCPNMSECWADGTATFMVLGDRCTRACGFCLVDTRKPMAPDADEPSRVAEAIDRMGLDHAVLTMVARDDLDDGGMAHVAACVDAIRLRRPTTRVETLISDVKGKAESLDVLFEVRPDVLNHNIESVARLQRAVRPSAGYARSLSVLAGEGGRARDKRADRGMGRPTPR